MKVLKLALISVIAFGLLFWGMTLLFPGTTVLSRALDLGVNADTLYRKLQTNYISIKDCLASDAAEGIDVRTSDIPFYAVQLYNMQDASAKADTLFLQVAAQGKVVVQGGLAFYPMGDNKSTAQLFYVFHTPWYKPWEKMFMMMADKKYGPQMEAVLVRIQEKAALP